jgi:hypothetical protein
MWVIRVGWSRVEQGTCQQVLFYKGLGHVEHVERIMWRMWNRDAPSTMMSWETYKSSKSYSVTPPPPLDLINPIRSTKLHSRSAPQ